MSTLWFPLLFVPVVLGITILILLLVLFIIIVRRAASAPTPTVVSTSLAATSVATTAAAVASSMAATLAAASVTAALAGVLLIVIAIGTSGKASFSQEPVGVRLGSLSILPGLGSGCRSLPGFLYLLGLSHAGASVPGVPKLIKLVLQPLQDDGVVSLGVPPGSLSPALLLGEPLQTLEQRGLLSSKVLRGLLLLAALLTELSGWRSDAEI